MSITKSASPLTGSSNTRSWAIDCSTPNFSSAKGCLRRVAPYRFTSSAVVASRYNNRTRCELLRKFLRTSMIPRCAVGVPTTSASFESFDPTEAISTTLSISSVGILSTTNQPKSSKSSAANERPAPDRPAINKISATNI